MQHCRSFKKWLRSSHITSKLCISLPCTCTWTCAMTIKWNLKSNLKTQGRFLFLSATYLSFYKLTFGNIIVWTMRSRWMGRWLDMEGGAGARWRDRWGDGQSENTANEGSRDSSTDGADWSVIHATGFPVDSERTETLEAKFSFYLPQQEALNFRENNSTSEKKSRNCISTM